MLYYQTVSPGALSLLKQLMNIPELNTFCLVGGTSLSLQLGHRISIDLDFFTDKSFDIDSTRKLLDNEINPFELGSVSKIGFSSFIKNIKCEFFNWSVPFIRPLIIEDNIRLCSLEDIAAFKLDAIITRKEKKDFWDIDALLSKFDFKALLKFYRQKFLYNDIKVALDALSEIDLADNSEDPNIILPRNWSDIKNRIKNEWKQFQYEKMKYKEIEQQERLRKAEELLKNKKR
jgi:predicted nucleotidyltransferase component of viral defense system